MAWGEWVDVPSSESGASPVLLSTRRLCHRESQCGPRVAVSPDLSLCRGVVQWGWWEESEKEGTKGQGG